MGKKFKAGLASLLVVLFIITGSESKAQDGAESVVFTLNGKVVDQKDCHTIQNLQGAPGLNTSKEIESITVYQVRGNRPIKQTKFEGTSALNNLDLVAWVQGSKDGRVSSSVKEMDLAAKADDRIAMHVVFKNGKSGTVNLCLK